ncbi:L-cysteine:1D-myo-inositol 2-amino-2-deoxy-alpha-D-glucopyranoside ligase [Kibdelosporangium banguiense]|uniref:Cysteine--tRNA ligase n=1 Tax=Kibdelosporangium banguiense TaxID=1365924 RepID=A0ABS4TE62_9PSEU|nr:cysteine--1-D-myo-inosityl 2-amino-2-deoxy-alpha-D-glucopyranoside ligase [Kibdelosporangium banguiense]MBP2322639.1 L-cysteine:1D-myo-inositol 2-amino-2-deoxy-alpha-D-glucopyranoside ligase [Kibdelosporangium banguiense]
MRLFDTATRAHTNVRLKDEMLIYVCGITPYESAHIGHAFTFLTYDLLQRRLESLGSRVRLVRNITDVDEPMYVKASELGMHYLQLAKHETAAFQRMMRAINLKDPDVEPKPSEHIDEIASAVKELVNRGVAYMLDGDIYFDVSQFPTFGRTSGYSAKLMTQFARIRGGDPDRTGKRHPLDFLLWRVINDKADPAAWDTTVGYGRPGWHIECTAMAYKHLGQTIDIHGGGTDLIFPHHECENAQSTALGSELFVRQWVHTAPMLLGGEKMSKSLGNLVFVRDLIERVDPAAIRIALMTYHYRTGGEWRDDVLQAAARLLDQVNHAVTRPDGADPRPYLARVQAALDNDLDAPEAMRAVRDMTQSLLIGGSDTTAAAGLSDMLTLLGITVPGASLRGTA